jgi:hypothetical protein
MLDLRSDLRRMRAHGHELSKGTRTVHPPIRFAPALRRHSAAVFQASSWDNGEPSKNSLETTAAAHGGHAGLDNIASAVATRVLTRQGMALKEQELHKSLGLVLFSAYVLGAASDLAGREQHCAGCAGAVRREDLNHHCTVCLPVQSYSKAVELI